jgi:hypothetical protein
MTRHFRNFAAAAALGSLAVIAACDSTEPSQESITFTTQLSPANEVPPVTNAEASGGGTGTIVLRVNRDSGGAITSATADFQVSLTNFPTGTTLNGAHIHRGAVGVAGPIVVDSGLTGGQVVLTTGAGAFTRNGIAVSASLAQEILSSPASFYLNIHSVLNGTGMARGQLVRQ